MFATRGLYRFTVVTAVLTYVLIVFGGIVHNTDSGMACPDWPLCFGEVFPALKAGIFYEHGHRYLATLVGIGVLVIVARLWRAHGPDPALARSKKRLLWSMLALLAVAMILITPIGQGNDHWGSFSRPAEVAPDLDPERGGGWPGLIAIIEHKVSGGSAPLAARPVNAAGKHDLDWAFWFTALLAAGMYAIAFRALTYRRGGEEGLAFKAIGLLMLILVQGLLGGYTVAYNLPSLVSTAHLATSMLVLLTLVYLAWELRRHLLAAEGRLPEEWPQAGAARAAGLVTTVTALVFLQIVLGALVRHTQSSWIAGIGWAHSIIGQDPLTGQLSLWPGTGAAKLNVLHRYIGFAMLLLLGWSGWRAHEALADAIGDRMGRLMLIWLPLQIVMLQVLVGVVMLGFGMELSLRTMHLAVGTLVLVAQFVLLIDVRGALRPAPAALAVANSAPSAAPLAVQ